jgi:hypothetical protein
MVIVRFGDFKLWEALSAPLVPIRKAPPLLSPRAARHGPSMWRYIYC